MLPKCPQLLLFYLPWPVASCYEISNCHHVPFERWLRFIGGQSCCLLRICEVWLISAYEVLWNSCMNDVTETLNIAAVIQAGTRLKIWCCKVWLGLTSSLGKYSGFLWIPSGKLVQSSNQTKPKHFNRPRVGKNNKKKIRWRIFLRTHCLSRILHL